MMYLICVWQRGSCKQIFWRAKHYINTYQFHTSSLSWLVVYNIQIYKFFGRNSRTSPSPPLNILLFATLTCTTFISVYIVHNVYNSLVIFSHRNTYCLTRFSSISLARLIIPATATCYVWENFFFRCKDDRLSSLRALTFKSAYAFTNKRRSVIELTVYLISAWVKRKWRFRMHDKSELS